MKHDVHIVRTIEANHLGLYGYSMNDGRLMARVTYYFLDILCWSAISPNDICSSLMPHGGKFILQTASKKLKKKSQFFV